MATSAQQAPGPLEWPEERQGPPGPGVPALERSTMPHIHYESRAVAFALDLNPHSSI